MHCEVINGLDSNTGFSLTRLSLYSLAQWPDSACGLQCIKLHTQPNTHMHICKKSACQKPYFTAYGKKEGCINYMFSFAYIHTCTNTRTNREEPRGGPVHIPFFSLRQRTQSVRMIESLYVKDRGTGTWPRERERERVHCVCARCVCTCTRTHVVFPV